MIRMSVLLWAALLACGLPVQGASTVPASAKHAAVKVSLHEGTQTVTIKGTAYAVTVKHHHVVRVVRKTRSGHGFASTPLSVTNASAAHQCYNCWYDEHGNWICMYQSC